MDIRKCKKCRIKLTRRNQKIYCSRRCWALFYAFKKGCQKPANAYTWGEGKNNPNWKGGEWKSYQGYIMVKIARNKWNKRCRVVIEKELGIKLTHKDIVHHINEIKTDDRIENLEITTRAEHCRHHRLHCYNRSIVL